MAENDLDLSFEVDEEEEGEEVEQTSSSDSDNDEGDLGDMDLDGDNFAAADRGLGQALVTDGSASGRGAPAAPVPAGAAAYQHEPEPRHAPEQADDHDGDEVWPRRNRDVTRLDPNNTANWCECGHCRVLPSFEVGDCICCREIPEVAAEVDRLELTRCITEAPSFHAAVLDPITLYVAWQHFTEKWRRQAKSFGARNNEKYRYVAYRQFVRWCWGFLGRYRRVQLPACVQADIKDAYPDGAGIYKGTVLRRLELD